MFKSLLIRLKTLMKLINIKKESKFKKLLMKTKLKNLKKKN